MRLPLPPAPLAAIAVGGVLLLRWLVRQAVSDTSIADQIVSKARADLVVREESTNDGPRIREYFAGSGITPPANWCAAATTTWIREAASALGVLPPIKGSMQARKIGEEIANLARAGVSGAQWFTADEIRRDPSVIKPGDVVVWDRSDPTKPETSWYGHVGIVIEPATGGTFKTIEGNSGQVGDRVAEMSRTVSDARLIGSGRAWAPGTVQHKNAQTARSVRSNAKPFLMTTAPWWDAA